MNARGQVTVNIRVAHPKVADTQTNHGQSWSIMVMLVIT